MGRRKMGSCFTCFLLRFSDRVRPLFVDSGVAVNTRQRRGRTGAPGDNTCERSYCPAHRSADLSNTSTDFAISCKVTHSRWLCSSCIPVKMFGVGQSAG
jgi:hypothetical protein